MAEAFKIDLGHLTQILELDEVLGSVPISAIAPQAGLCSQVIHQLNSLLASSRPLEQAILNERLFHDRPRTLAQIGSQEGVSRERVRQLENRVTKRLELNVLPIVEKIVSIMRYRFDDCLPAATLDNEIIRLFDDRLDTSAQIARRILKERLGYTLCGAVCLSHDARNVIKGLESTARQLADPVGLVDEEKLRESLPDLRWTRHWQILLTCSSLPRINGHLALRDTVKARVKAGVIQLGRIATKEEIATTAGVEAERVGSFLSAIPGIERADKFRWGLSNWIDDVYEGIPAEIIQRIEAGGGSTSVQHLLKEIPRMFRVEEASVRAYLSSSQFRVSSGQVTLASPSQIRYRDLDDVIDGRDDKGNPLWQFSVAERFFDGFSITGVPAEIARELGCGPNERILVPVVEPTGCSDVSVNFRLSALTGASIGQVSSALEKLGVSPGDSVQLVLLSRGIALRKPTPTVEDSSASDADRFLDRLKRRQRFL